MDVHEDPLQELSHKSSWYHSEEEQTGKMAADSGLVQSVRDKRQQWY